MSSDSRWFKIAVLLISGFFIGFSIANIIYYNRLKDSRNNTLTHGEAESMLWINVILLIIALILFFWSIYVLLVHHRTLLVPTTDLYPPSEIPNAASNVAYGANGAVPVQNTTIYSSTSATRDVVPQSISSLDQQTLGWEKINSGY